MTGSRAMQLSLCLSGILVSTFLSPTATKALETPAPLAPADDPDTQRPFFAPEGRGVVTLAGELEIVDPSKLTPAGHVLAGGLSVQAVLGLEPWPFMVGLGAGFLRFAERDLSSPRAGNLEDDPYVVGTTRPVSTSELRHAELVLRIEPWWGRVRPYAEGIFGFATLWDTSVVQDDRNNDIVTRDEQRSIALLYGVSAGVELRVLSLGTYQAAHSDLTVAIGVKRLWTGTMEQEVRTVTADNERRTSTVESGLRIWCPFVTLSVSVDSRTSAP
jgi:hypothetical protein